MQPIPVPFGEWLPDQADYENPGLVEAKNVIPTPGGYDPAKSAGSTSYGAKTSATPIAAWGFTGLQPSVDPWGVVLSEGSIDIFLLANTGPSPSATVSVTNSASLGFSATRFGDNAIIGGSGGLRYTDLASPSWSSITLPFGGGFGTAVGKINEFLFASPLVSTNFYWSAFNDFTDFTASQRTQAGSAVVDTPRLGNVTCFEQGRSGLMFQELGTTRLDYVGAPRIWQDTLISDTYGCPSPSGATTHKNITYFMSFLGPCATDGASVVPIGDGKVMEWVQDNLTEDEIKLCVASVNTVDEVVEWRFTSVANGTRFLIYSPVTGTFSRIEDDRLNVFSIRNDAYTVAEDGSDYDIVLLDGATLAAEMTTGHSSLVPGARVEINDFEPVYTGSGATCAVSTKQTINGSATVTSYASQNASTGICNVLGSGRTAAASVRFAAGASWSEFAGVIANSGLAGTR